MIKTQVQIPDHLYREAKRVAAENEMSFAEVVRRGIEKVVNNIPAGGSPRRTGGHRSRRIWEKSWHRRKSGRR